MILAGSLNWILVRIFSFSKDFLIAYFYPSTILIIAVAGFYVEREFILVIDTPFLYLFLN